MPFDGIAAVLEAGQRRRFGLRRRFSIDYETFSEVQLVGAKSVGVWNYSTDLSTRALMVSWAWDGEDVQTVDLTVEAFPEELREALLDPTVEKWAFNAAFERLITKNCLGIDTPYEGWRCTMALANMQSFSGNLLEVGTNMGLPQDVVKGVEGKRLIHLFCEPQKITRKNSEWVRTRETDADDWQMFLDYNNQDVVAENAVRDILLRFYIPDDEWRLYELDQKINDRGLPVNAKYVRQAEILSDLRKYELTVDLRELTGLNNPNSPPQLLAWLRNEGYPFNDLRKDTVKKVLGEDKARRVGLPDHEAVYGDVMTRVGIKVLKLRQQAARTSVRKYPAITRRLSSDGTIKHAFQFAGAPRTVRWSGRGPQPHNLTRTPKALEAEHGDASKLEIVARMIEAGDYSGLSFMFEEPMEALAGCIRSSFQAPKGKELRVCDLSAIESAVIAWLSGCERLLSVFREKRDPYRDFGVELYKKAYEEITGAERTVCKPAVLGCGYQLGGGVLREGKRTGLWGYAESNGVDLTQAEAHAHVKLFRTIYPEIPEFWKALEHAALRAYNGHPTTVRGLLRFARQGPYLTVTLPSGRVMYYYKPRVVVRQFEREDGSTYTRKVMSYMGMNQVTHQWQRVFTSGGKWAENVTQATARDILATGMLRADAIGFNLIGHVHDELITLCRKGDNFYDVGMMRQCMISDITWAKGLPLGAAGYAADIYRKD